MVLVVMIRAAPRRLQQVIRAPGEHAVHRHTPGSGRARRQQVFTVSAMVWPVERMSSTSTGVAQPGRYTGHFHRTSVSLRRVFPATT